MSSCLILQEQNRIFIGADTASSICIEGKYYRYSNDAQKIFNIGNDLLFCSGNMNVVKEVIEYTRYIILNNYININLLSEYLKLYYSIQKENVFDIEIMLCRIENNESVIYQISQYNNYNPIIYKVEKDNIQLLSGGIETELSSNISQKCLSNRNTVKETYVTVFNTISSEKIGGKLLVYELSKDELKLIINYDIVEKNNLQFSKTVTPHLVVADAVVGKLMLTSKLIVENANSSVILNENGATLQNCDIKITKDTSILKLNATDGIKLTNNGVNQFYIDGSGNATFVGIIKGGSININNKFIVDANGNLTANNATLNNGTFSGTLNGATGTFSGNLSAAGGTFTGTLSGATGSFSGSLTASSIATNSGNFTVNSSGIMTARSGVLDNSIFTNGMYYRFSGIDFPIFQVPSQGILQIASSTIHSRFMGSLEATNATFSNLYVGNKSLDSIISGYTSGFAPSSHYHGTLYAGSSSSGYTAYISTSANFVCPNNGDLGTSSNPWISVRANNVYNSAGLITSSDERKKNTIEPLNNKYSMLFDRLNPVSYRYNNGTSGRTHLGLIAQEVEQAMAEVELTDKECAILVKDPVYSEINEDGSYDETSEIIDYDYSIRYSELIPLLIGKIKDLELKVNKFEQLI